MTGQLVKQMIQTREAKMAPEKKKVIYTLQARNADEGEPNWFTIKRFRSSYRANDRKDSLNKLSELGETSWAYRVVSTEE